MVRMAQPDLRGSVTAGGEMARERKLTKRSQATETLSRVPEFLMR